MRHDDTTWTTGEARERAAFVLGVSCDASTEDARRRYREQLAVHAGTSERELTAQRTLTAAWGVWNATTPDIDVGIEFESLTRVTTTRPERSGVGGPTIGALVTDLLGSVEVLEVSRVARRASTVVTLDDAADIDLVAMPVDRRDPDPRDAHLRDVTGVDGPADARRGIGGRRAYGTIAGLTGRHATDVVV